MLLCVGSEAPGVQRKGKRGRSPAEGGVEGQRGKAARGGGKSALAGVLSVSGALAAATASTKHHHTRPHKAAATEHPIRKSIQDRTHANLFVSARTHILRAFAHTRFPACHVAIAPHYIRGTTTHKLASSSAAVDDLVAQDHAWMDVRARVPSKLNSKLMQLV